MLRPLRQPNALLDAARTLSPNGGSSFSWGVVTYVADEVYTVDMGAGNLVTLRSLIGARVGELVWIAHHKERAVIVGPETSVVALTEADVTNKHANISDIDIRATRRGREATLLAQIVVGADIGATAQLFTTPAWLVPFYSIAGVAWLAAGGYTDVALWTSGDVRNWSATLVTGTHSFAFSYITAT